MSPLKCHVIPSEAQRSRGIRRCRHRTWLSSCWVEPRDSSTALGMTTRVGVPSLGCDK